MYDPQLGRFTTQDAFAEKYLDLSPYQYAANNPILFIDVNGDSLWIRYRGEQILYQDGQLYNKDGTAYSGKGLKDDGTYKGFLKHAVNSLNEISSGTEGDNMVNELQSSLDNFFVKKTSGGNYYNKDENTAYFNRWNTSSSLDTRGLTERPAYIGLGHELAHALDDKRGTMQGGYVPGFGPGSISPDFKGVPNAEIFATTMENKLRVEHGLPLRTHYGYNQSTNTGIFPILNGRNSTGGYNYYGALKMAPIRALIPATSTPGSIKIR
jgi:uncharacterized protein RhaS with RHS repeats